MTATRSPFGFDRPGSDLPSLDESPSFQTPSLSVLDGGLERLQRTVGLLQTSLEKTIKSGRPVDLPTLTAIHIAGQQMIDGVVLEVQKELATAYGVTLDAAHLMMAEMPK